MCFFSEVYYKAGVSAEQFQQQLEYQLRKTTLGVSVGLVKGKELEVAHYFNPYIHFVPRFYNTTEKDSNRYKICETKPPSIEKVNMGSKFMTYQPVGIQMISPS